MCLVLPVGLILYAKFPRSQRIDSIFEPDDPMEIDLLSKLDSSIHLSRL